VANYRRLHSIKFKYLMLVVVAVVGFAAAGAVLLVRLRDEAIRSAGEYSLGGLRTVAVSVDEIAKNVEFVFTPLLTNQGFVDLVRNLAFLDPVSSYSALLQKGQLEEILGKAYLSNNYVQSLTYLDIANHVAIVARADLQKARDVDVGATAWYGNYQKVENRSWWTVNSGLTSGDRVLSIYRPVRVNEGGWKTKGILSINVATAVVDAIFKKITQGRTGRSFVLDSLGNVAASVGTTSAAEIGRITAAFAGAPAGRDYLTVALEGGPSLVARHVSTQSGLSYVTVLPLREVTTFLPIVVTSIAYTYVGLMVVVAAMALITYLSYYRPLNTLFLGMKSLAAGDFTVSLDSTRRDEVGYIYEGFNRTVRDLKRLIDDNYLIQLGQKDAQLKMVLSQLNEHFLYNTLDCIHWLARKHNVSEISDVVFSLSRFYSLSLSNGRDVIPVKEIIGIIRSYMDIQLVRRPDGFRCQWRVDPSLEELHVLKYLFQPLVENAVIHGLADTTSDGLVDISFTRAGDSLRFQVTDNGKGIAPERLAAIRADLDGGSNDGAVAFALCNVNTQVRLYYGEPCGLFIESTPGAGTRAWIDLPLARCGAVGA
jgi:two-component system, sensor histidine kinase YesM